MAMDGTQEIDTLWSAELAKESVHDRISEPRAAELVEKLVTERLLNFVDLGWRLARGWKGRARADVDNVVLGGGTRRRGGLE